jgi:hypothetical protein
MNVILDVFKLPQGAYEIVTRVLEYVMEYNANAQAYTCERLKAEGDK